MSKHFCLLLLVLPGICFSQNRIGTGKVAELFNQYCASCHSEDLSGGLGGSLLSGEWKHIGPELSFIDYVAKGDLQMGMPPFESALDRQQLRSLEIYVAEMQQKASRAEAPVVSKEGDHYQAGGAHFKLEVVVDGLDHPWALSFLPDGRGLYTERSGELFLLELSGRVTPVEGIPNDIWVRGQGGLMEAAPHPEYAENGWIYLGYASSGGERDGKKQGMTKIVRGKIVEDQWRDEETVFETPFEFHRSAGVHFGTRFVFKDGYLFFGIGDRGAQDHAQDLSRPNGKIHRIHDDGRVPQDNPFIDQADAYPSIWSYGNRNPQGLAYIQSPAHCGSPSMDHEVGMRSIGSKAARTTVGQLSPTA